MSQVLVPVLLVLGAVSQGLGGGFGVPAAPAYLTRVDARQGSLHDVIAERIRGMNAAGKGIFNENVTALVAPFFPVGTTLDQLRTLVGRQGLKRLQPYHETRSPGLGTMYVTSFDAMNATFSSVYVVFYFTFAKNMGGRQTLANVDAFLRASDM